MPKRKRAPGGGTKPRGPFKGKSATLTTRITPETRAELERSAKEQGRSLSQEVEARLRDFANQNRPRHIRAFADAISILVTDIESRTGMSCLDDPFTADAVRQAISALMLRLIPVSDAPPSPPPKIKATVAKLPSLTGFMNPISLGELVYEGLIRSIEEAALSNYETSGLSYPAPGGLSRIRHDLGIGINREKK